MTQQIFELKGCCLRHHRGDHRTNRPQGLEASRQLWRIRTDDCNTVPRTDAVIPQHVGHPPCILKLLLIRIASIQEMKSCISSVMLQIVVFPRGDVCRGERGTNTYCCHTLPPRWNEGFFCGREGRGSHPEI